MPELKQNQRNFLRDLGVTLTDTTDDNFDFTVPFVGRHADAKGLARPYHEPLFQYMLNVAENKAHAVPASASFGSEFGSDFSVKICDVEDAVRRHVRRLAEKHIVIFEETPKFYQHPQEPELVKKCNLMLEINRN